MHVCPLQFDIVDRLINRYTNVEDLVFDPFGGIGTVPLRALKAGRRGLMTELNADYFRDAVGYLDAEEAKIETPTLFDLLGESETEADKAPIRWILWDALDVPDWCIDGSGRIKWLITRSSVYVNDDPRRMEKRIVGRLRVAR